MIAEALSAARGRTFVPFTQCAWCGGISLCGHYFRIPGVGKILCRLTINLPMSVQLEFALSHGICPTCADKITEQVTKARLAGSPSQ